MIESDKGGTGVPPFTMCGWFVLERKKNVKKIFICLMFALILSMKMFIIYLLGGLLYDDI